MISMARNLEIEITIFGGHPISRNMSSTKEEASIFCTYSLRVGGIYFKTIIVQQIRT